MMRIEQSGFGIGHEFGFFSGASDAFLSSKPQPFDSQLTAQGIREWRREQPV